MWLTFRGVFEPAVGDGSQKLGLEEEVFKSGGMDADVTTLHSRSTRDGEVALLLGAICCGCWRGGGGGVVGRDILVGVVDEILLVRHV